MACEGGIRMARQFPPGAWMYQVEWQGNGVSLGRLYISATNENDVLAQENVSSPTILLSIFAATILTPR